MSENYESFRSVLLSNLCSRLKDQEEIRTVMSIVDLSMADFEIHRKSTAIIPVDGIPEMLKCYLASKAVANLSKGSLKQYNYKLSDFFRSVRKSCETVSTNDIRLYLYNFKTSRNASDRYLESIRITINGFFQWLVDNEYIQRNPCVKIEKIHYQQKKREPLSTFSLEDIRWNCKTMREKALIDFLFSTGCRISECAGVELSDINWENKSVLIRHGKGGKQCVVYFNDEAKVSVRAYLSSRSDNTPALFVSDRKPHQALKSHALENIVRSVGERAGIRVYPHKLRHTFATIGLRNGMPLEKLQALLGHSSPETTLVYAKQDSEQIHMEHQKVFC